MSKQTLLTNSWWTTGDMPVRTTSQLAFLVDGRMTMLEMCICFLSAKSTIYITAFGLTPELLLVRGKHKSAGPPNSPAQKTLVSWLRAKGLAEKELTFWQECEELSVSNVLRYVVGKGVDVRVLLWDTYTLTTSIHEVPKKVQARLEELGVHCVLDDSHKGLLNHPLEAHHQKTAIVDNQLAFVGGIDVMMNSDGDFDRWDTKGHPFYTQLRVSKAGKVSHSWHDVHVLFGGPAVADVELNFRQRWNAVLDLHKADPSLLLSAPTPGPLASAPHPGRLPHTTHLANIQVIRTIPPGSYPFVPPDGIATILDAYRRAFSQARRHIYIENQYLWQRTFLGFENPALGLPHTDMQELLHSLADALAREVVVTIVLPDNPNVGREFTDEGIKALLELAPQALDNGTLQIYTLGSSLEKDGQTYYRSIYVHAKTTIIDDTWITLGSANLNNRGMRNDTELNVALLHPALARHLRILLMAEHLGIYDEDILFQMLNTMAKLPFSTSITRRTRLKRRLYSWLQPRKLLQPITYPISTSDPDDDEINTYWNMLISRLGDPLQASTQFAQQARANLQAVKVGRSITGHLLPYIPHDRSKDYDIHLNAVNGWLDTLPQPEFTFENTSPIST